MNSSLTNNNLTSSNLTNSNLTFGADPELGVYDLRTFRWVSPGRIDLRNAPVPYSVPIYRTMSTHYDNQGNMYKVPITYSYDGGGVEIRPLPGYSPEQFAEHWWSLFRFSKRKLWKLAKKIFVASPVSANNMPSGGHIHIGGLKILSALRKINIGNMINNICTGLLYLRCLDTPDSVSSRIRTGYGGDRSIRVPIDTDTIEFRSPSPTWLSRPLLSLTTMQYVQDLACKGPSNGVMYVRLWSKGQRNLRKYFRELRSMILDMGVSPEYLDIFDEYSHRFNEERRKFGLIRGAIVFEGKDVGRYIQRRLWGRR